MNVEKVQRTMGWRGGLPLLCAIACGLLLAVPPLPAHPISIISCEALVRRDRMEMKIAVMPEDFLLVYGLYANAQSRIATDDITHSAEKHKKFLLDGLIVRDEDGNRLQGKVLGLEMPALPAEGLPVTDLMATTIVYRLEYPLAKPPAHLTFQQHFGGDAIMLPAIVDLVVTREGLPPEPATRIPADENVETVSFDWNETARPATGDYAEIKAREEEKRKQNMGIASYSATHTFVYIQNEEVRVEILMPLLTLETWQPLARSNADFIEVSEQTAARGPLESFFTGQNELKIDGVAVKPKLERLDFYGVDFKDFAMSAEPRRLSAWTARVGAILTYSTKGAPGHVELKWTLFNNEMLAARAVIFAYDKASRFTFYPLGQSRRAATAVRDRGFHRRKIARGGRRIAAAQCLSRLRLSQRVGHLRRAGAQCAGRFAGGFVFENQTGPHHAGAGRRGRPRAGSQSRANRTGGGRRQERLRRARHLAGRGDRRALGPRSRARQRVLRRAGN